MSEPEVFGLRVIVPRWMPCVQLEGAAPELDCAAFPTRSLLRKLGPFNAWIAKWTFSPLSSLASSQAERALRGGPPRLLRSCLLLITVYSQQETSSANRQEKLKSVKELHKFPFWIKIHPSLWKTTHTNVDKYFSLFIWDGLLKIIIIITVSNLCCFLWAEKWKTFSQDCLSFRTYTLDKK